MARACFCFCVLVIWLLSSFSVGCFVIACFLFFVCLEFQIIWFVISTFTPIFFIEISFVLPPPPPAHLQARRTPPLHWPETSEHSRHIRSHQEGLQPVSCVLHCLFLSRLSLSFKCEWTLVLENDTPCHATYLSYSFKSVLIICPASFTLPGHSPRKRLLLLRLQWKFG